jgi:hypothetical protein
VVVALAMPALAHAGDAQAFTYCAGTSGADCSASFPATGDGVQQALTTADNNANIDNSPNTVRIGAGTFTRTNGQGYQVNSPVIVTGQDAATVLTASPSSGGAVNDAFKSTGSPSTLRDLVVRVTGLAFAGVSGFGTVADVRVTGPGAHDYGVFLPAGGRGSRLLLDPASIPPYGGGVLLKSGGVLEDSVIRVRGPNTRGVAVSDVDGSVQPATVRHVTILGNGSDAGTRGVQVVIARGNGSPRVATGLVRDSVIRGVATPLARQGEAAGTGCIPGPCTAGTANLTVRYSSFDTAPSSRVDTGPGTFTLGPGNLNDPDPRFVNLPGDDLRLLAGSPLIDAGDPAGPEAGDSPTDAGGSPRIANGRRDIGAFEGGVVPAGEDLPPAGGSITPDPAADDSTAPELSSVKLSRATFRVGTLPTAVASASRRRARQPGKGTTIAYTLSEAAAITFTLRRELAGRLVKKRGRKQRVCVRETRSNRTRANKRCTLEQRAGTLTRNAVAGKNTLAFSGRIGRKQLSPGRYRVTITARDAAGNTSRPKRITFRIVK